MNGYQAGVEAAAKVAEGKRMLGRSHICALHEAGWNGAVGFTVEAIRALLTGGKEKG